MYAQKDQDSIPVVTASLPAHPPMLRWLAGRSRAIGMTLTGAGWAATFAAVIGGSQSGRGTALQIAFAAAMITVAMGETLVSSAGPRSALAGAPACLPRSPWPAH